MAEMFVTARILTMVTKTLTETIQKFKLWLMRETWIVAVQQKLGLWHLCKIRTVVAL